jgi:hypothetical protein
MGDSFSDVFERETSNEMILSQTSVQTTDLISN